MPQTVSAHMMLTLDGFGTGLNQTRENPFGTINPRDLARWMFEDGADNADEVKAVTDYGAFIMGRNMFAAPGEAVWEDSWRGWILAARQTQANNPPPGHPRASEKLFSRSKGYPLSRE